MFSAVVTFVHGPIYLKGEAHRGRIKNDGEIIDICQVSFFFKSWRQLSLSLSLSLSFSTCFTSGNLGMPQLIVVTAFSRVAWSFEASERQRTPKMTRGLLQGAHTRLRTSDDSLTKYFSPISDKRQPRDCVGIACASLIESVIGKNDY